MLSDGPVPVVTLLNTHWHKKKEEIGNKTSLVDRGRDSPECLIPFEIVGSFLSLSLSYCWPW
jgi:hypothetical protein